MIADYFCEEDSEEDGKHYYYFLILFNFVSMNNIVNNE